MKIFGVETIDVRGVPNGIYSFAKDAHSAHDRVLISGGPSTGKTRLLDVIVAVREVCAPSDERIDTDPFVRRRNSASKAIVSWLLTPEEQTTIGSANDVVVTEVIFGISTPAEGIDPGIVHLLDRYAHDDKTPKLEYFSERRRLELGGGEGKLDEDNQRPLRVSASPRKFSWVESFMGTLRVSPEREDRFARLLEALSSSAGYDQALHAIFSKGRAIRNLTELTASEADAVMFAATATLTGLSHSIVLIDRPELHGIEPNRVLSGLSELGVDNQLIMASGSPELAAAFVGAVLKLDADVQQNRGLG